VGVALRVVLGGNLLEDERCQLGHAVMQVIEGHAPHIAKPEVTAATTAFWQVLNTSVQRHSQQALSRQSYNCCTQSDEAATAVEWLHTHCVRGLQGSRHMSHLALVGLMLLTGSRLISSASLRSRCTMGSMPKLLTA
jgi:hypothetical protein